MPIYPRSRGLIAKRDRRECAAIDWLAAETGTPITEETRAFGDRVTSGAADDRNPRASEPALDIARQVEHEMAGSQCRREISRAGRVMREKLLRELRPDLVGGLGDARSDPSADAGPLGAQCLHPVESGLDDSTERAAPAAMRGADDIGNRIGEQDGGTIGSEDPKGNARNARGQAVGPWCRIMGPGPFYRHHRSAVDLMAGHQAGGRKAQPLRCDGAIARNRLGCITRSESAVQRCEETAADPTLAGKEAM